MCGVPCGEPARGTVERLSGVAEFKQPPAPQGQAEYNDYPEVWWEEQRTACQDDSKPEAGDNLPLVCCPNGHEWPTAINWDGVEQ